MTFPTPEGMDERLLTGYSGRLLIFLSVGFMGVTVTRQLLPPLLPTIIEDLAITATTAGIALSTMWGLYALCHYPGGHLADTLTRKTVLVAGCVSLTLGICLMILSVSYPLFILSVVFIGCGAGFYFISVRVLLSEMYVQRRGAAFGLQMALGFIGPILAAGLAVVALDLPTWRLVFVPLAVAMAIVLLLGHRWLWEPYDFAVSAPPVHATAKRLFSNRNVGVFLGVYVLYQVTYLGYMGFLPTLLQTEKGFSPTLASAGFATVFAVALVALPVAGWLGDRVGHVRMALLGLAIATAGLVGLLIAVSIVGVLSGIVLFSIGIWTYPPVMQAYLMNQFADASMGGDFGAFKTIYTGLGALSPSYVGIVADLASYTLAFWTLGGCLGVAALIVAVQGLWGEFKS